VSSPPQPDDTTARTPAASAASPSRGASQPRRHRPPQGASWRRPLAPDRLRRRSRSRRGAAACSASLVPCDRPSWPRRSSRGHDAERLRRIQTPAWPRSPCHAVAFLVESRKGVLDPSRRAWPRGFVGPAPESHQRTAPDTLVSCSCAEGCPTRHTIMLLTQRRDQPVRRLAVRDAPPVLGACRLGRGSRRGCSLLARRHRWAGGSREPAGIGPVRLMSARWCSFSSTAPGTAAGAGDA
jgi:hypothetical protein